MTNIPSKLHTDETIENAKALFLKGLSDLDILLSQVHDRIQQTLTHGEYLSDLEITELVSTLIKSNDATIKYSPQTGSEFDIGKVSIFSGDSNEHYREMILSDISSLSRGVRGASFEFVNPALQRIIRTLGYTLSQGIQVDSTNDEILYVFLASFFSMYAFKYHTKAWDLLDGYEFSHKEELLSIKTDIQNQNISEDAIEQISLYYAQLCYHLIQKGTGSSAGWDSLSVNNQDQLLSNFIFHLIFHLDCHGEFSLFFRQLFEGLEYSREALRSIISEYQSKKAFIVGDTNDTRQYTKFLRYFREKINKVPTLIVPDKFSFISTAPGSLDVLMDSSDTPGISHLELADIALIIQVLKHFLVFEEIYHEIPITFQKFQVDTHHPIANPVRTEVSIVAKNQQFLAKVQTRLETISGGIQGNPTRADLRRFRGELSDMRLKMNDILTECISYNTQIESNLHSLSQFIETLQLCLENISRLSEYKKKEVDQEGENTVPMSGILIPENTEVFDTERREYYLDILKECRKIADTSTKKNASTGDSESVADGSVSNAIGKFLHFFQGLIERNKILLDDSFSWNQVYDLWTKQHDMNGRRDKMAQSVLRPMVENHDEKIVGIHSSASFEVAFPMLYDIIEYYANGKTQKEEKNKKWCSLYLPKLKSFISEYFPDK